MDKREKRESKLEVLHNNGWDIKGKDIVPPVLIF